MFGKLKSDENMPQNTCKVQYMHRKKKHHKTLLLSISIRNWVESRNFDYWLALNIIKPKLERFRDLGKENGCTFWSLFAPVALRWPRRSRAKQHTKLYRQTQKLAKIPLFAQLPAKERHLKTTMLSGA